MSEKRVNTETGVFEENNGAFFIDNWQPVTNPEGNEERLNTDTGVIEENRGCFLIDDWQPKK